MKFIRTWLKKHLLNYQEGWKYPNLYTALEQSVFIIKQASSSLAIEADRLEQVSRSAYNWLKVISPTKNASEVARKPTWDEWQEKKAQEAQNHPRRFCMCCKAKVAVDDSNVLCSYCSGINDNKNISNIQCGKCSHCSMPCKLGEAYCDLCSAGNRESDKNTTSPFGMTNKEFPLDSISSHGDMLLSTRRNGVN